MGITKPCREPWKKHPAVGREEGCGPGAGRVQGERCLSCSKQEADLLPRAGAAARAAAGMSQVCGVLVGVARCGHVPAVPVVCSVVLSAKQVVEGN